MQIHNYELPAKAEKLIRKAYLQCQDAEVKEKLGDAIDVLRTYLSQDNIVEVED